MKFSSGQISRVLIIVAAVILVVIIVFYVTLRLVVGTKNSTAKKQTQTSSQPPPPPAPVYDLALDDTRFVLISAQDLGNDLPAKSAFDQDLTTTEKFIRVAVGAQNLGKADLPQYSWDLGDIVDSAGRHFVNIDDKAYSYMPKPDRCGALLKPAFDPVPCVKYYEVSKVSTRLKIEVKTTDPKRQQAMLDLLVE